MQDLPEVPSAAPSVENVEEELDLPDVPTKPPVIADAVNEDAQETSAGITERKKGFSFLLLVSSNTSTGYEVY